MDSLIAAELSDQAYGFDKNYFPDGWIQFKEPYTTGGNGISSLDDGLTVFINTAIHEVAFAFKGSDNIQDFVSDLKPGDQGASIWDAVQPLADKAWADIAASVVVR